MFKKFKLFTVEKLTWSETGALWKDTITGFLSGNGFFHGAALSYYTIFALIPIIYLSILIFGQFIGQENMVFIIKSILTEQVGIEDVSGILQFLNKIDFESGSFVLKVIGIVSLIFTSTALFASLRNSINTFYGIEAYQHEKRGKAILQTVIQRLISIGLLAAFGLILMLSYFAQLLIMSIGKDFLNELTSYQAFIVEILQHGVVLISNVIIFFFIFKFLNNGKVYWKFALAGSFVTAVLTYFGHMGIKYYLTNFFFAKNGGIAGSLLIILAFVYYSSQIIFFGAKFTAVFAQKSGRPIEDEVKINSL